MSKKKTTKKEPTELTLGCSCGARAQIFSLGDKGYMAHCPGCGSLTFFHNPQLLERVKLGGELCPHAPQQKPCPGGFTTWCPICRIRRFYYNSESKE